MRMHAPLALLAVLEDVGDDAQAGKAVLDFLVIRVLVRAVARRRFSERACAS